MNRKVVLFGIGVPSLIWAMAFSVLLATTAPAAPTKDAKGGAAYSLRHSPEGLFHKIVHFFTGGWK